MKANMWQTAYALKALPRTGWLRKDIELPESVAAHSWGLAMLCLEFAPRIEPPLDISRVLQLALVHDAPEAIVGDITPHDGITKVEKQQLEKMAASKMLAPHMFNLWIEYEENTTREAQFVHAMDKIDMALQASIYASEADTTEFIQSAWKKTPKEYHWIWTEINLNPPKSG